MKSNWIAITILAAAFGAAVPSIAQVPAAKTAETSKPNPGKTAAVTPAPTDAEIADAKTKGLVWVNTSTKVYHKDGAYFGKTKKGKFMTEDEATKAGYKAAKDPVTKKDKADPKK
jgi:hypothetical protein